MPTQINGLLSELNQPDNGAQAQFDVNFDNNEMVDITPGATAHLPSPKPQPTSFFGRLKNSAYKTAKKSAGWLGSTLWGGGSKIASFFGGLAYDRLMPLVITNPQLRNSVTSLVNTFTSPGADVDAKIEAAVNSIPPAALEEMTRVAIKEVVTPIAASYAREVVRRTPIVGSVLGLVNTASGFQGLVRDALIPEIGLAERQLRRAAKYNIGESHFSNFCAEYIRDNMKSALAPTLKFAVQLYQGYKPTEITKHSVLDNVKTFTMDENPVNGQSQVKDKSQESIIQEYIKAKALKEFATMMSKNVLDTVSFLKQVNLLGYDPDKLALGYATDIGIAIIPRTLAHAAYSYITSSGFESVDADTKIKNAEALAKKLGFTLPEPTTAQMIGAVKELSQEQNPGVLALYNLRNKAAQYAKEKVSSLAREASIAAANTANGMYHQFRAKVLGNKSDGSIIPAISKNFIDRDFSNLKNVRACYVEAEKEFVKVELKLMEIREHLLGLRNDPSFNVESELKSVQEKFATLLPEAKAKAAVIKTDNNDRKLGVEKEAEAALNPMVSALSTLFKETEELKDFSADANAEPNAPERPRAVAAAR